MTQRPDDRTRFRSVAEDLRHLHDDWWTDPPPSVVRRGSVILRRFLAEGVLPRAWRAFDRTGEPVIPAPNLEEILGPRRDGLEVALAGGAHTGGIYAAGVAMKRGSDTQQNPDMDPESLLFPFRLGEFTESLSVWVPDGGVKRREVVKFFAHYEGGAHLHLSSKVRKKEESMVRRVSKFEGKVQVHVHEGLYFELLSIGQLVSRAPEVQDLLEDMESFFGLE